MSVSETDRFPYYEESDYPKYHDEWFWERERHSKEKYPTTYVPRERINDPNEPNISYFRDRQCPIYSHKLRKDSSVTNNYNYEIKKPVHLITSVDNASKLVLDKLEETYWANWKPKKPTPPLRPEKYRKDLPITENYDIREYTPKTTETTHRQTKKNHGQSQGDYNDVFVRYFKSFKPGNPFSHLTKPEDDSKKENASKKVTKKVKSAKGKKGKEDVKENVKTQTGKGKDSKKAEENITEPESETGVNETKEEEKVVIDVKGTRSTRSIKADDEDKKFVSHKDSIVITKEKLEKEENKEHYQLPRSIRLYRKAGTSSSFLKGGSYPLKTCLKREISREQTPKGNFKLGAPGSSLLFVTNKTGK